MEFLRFGSSIPGSYWGCCACDIIQNFKVDPDAKASIEIVDGDGGSGMGLFAGPTYRDIFEQRIRFGTFYTNDMPNHAFLAILTASQCNGGVGKKWLEILKANGFEFIRTVCNSVYAGASLSNTPGDSSRNYIFGLFRNIGSGNITDPFTPPAAWTNLPATVPEAWELVKQACDENGKTLVELSNLQRGHQRAIWDASKPKKLLTEEEVVKAGATVTLAGRRGGTSSAAVGFPQQTKAKREEFTKALLPLITSMQDKKETVSLKEPSATTGI